MKSAPALIEPEVLRWARESAGYSIDEASSPTLKDAPEKDKSMPVLEAARPEPVSVEAAIATSASTPALDDDDDDDVVTDDDRPGAR